MTYRVLTMPVILLAGVLALGACSEKPAEPAAPATPAAVTPATPATPAAAPAEPASGNASQGGAPTMAEDGTRGGGTKNPGQTN